MAARLQLLSLDAEEWTRRGGPFGFSSYKANIVRLQEVRIKHEHEPVY